MELSKNFGSYPTHHYFLPLLKIYIVWKKGHSTNQFVFSDLEEDEEEEGTILLSSVEEKK